MDSIKKSVFVAMSGGVDSSVAALLCQRAGYEVTGVFMKNWSDTKNDYGECSWKTERRDAERVAAKLGIPFLTFDFEEVYRHEVVAYMDREYAAGRTPNPDIMCNEKVKFDAFYKEAKRLGADLIATGHYAQSRDGVMLEARDQNKDQTYFLYRIKPEVLREVIFPIGHLLKSEVRALAAEAGLPTASKKDSQGLCFVGKVDMHDFLASRIPSVPGKVVSKTGEILGEHDGAAYYTIGQRHGLNLGIDKAQYVLARDMKTNTITVTEDKFDPGLMTREIELENTNWLLPVVSEMKIMARIRYRAPLANAMLRLREGKWLVAFDEPQWAAAPGQSVVCYEGGRVLGGGVIG